MEKFFETLYDEALESFNRVSEVLEESLGFDLNTEKQQPEQDPPLGGINIDDDEIFFEEEATPLKGMADSVLSDIMRNQARPDSFREHIEAFTSAIDWKEPLILGILCFQAFMFGTTIFVARSKNSSIQLIFMLILTIFCRSAGRINTYGSEHWEEIGATQNYFDTQGVFITSLVSFPLLFDCVLLLVCILWEAASLFIQVARLKVKAKMKREKEASNASSKKKSKSKPRGKTD